MLQHDHDTAALTRGVIAPDDGRNMTERRDQYIRLRLAPASEAATVAVAFSKAERAAVEKVAEQCGFVTGLAGGGLPGLSTFIRQLGIYASQDEQAQDVDTAIRTAAENAGMTVGEWLRIIVFGACGLSDLELHLSQARAAMEQGLIRPPQGA